MKLAIIGLPQSGKTTIYNALTRSNQPTDMGGKMEIHTAVVDVPDPRVTVLTEMYQPKKTAFAKVTYSDIAGLEGSGQGDISGKMVNELGQMDGFIQVVRCFESDNVPHISGTVDPGRDIQSMDSELLLNDLIVVERRIERLTDERKKGGRDKLAVEKEMALFEKLQNILMEDSPLRAADLSEEENKHISGYQFLTMKPMLIVLNLGESQDTPDVSSAIKDSRVVALQGQLEMEIAQLAPEEAEIFLKEYKIEEPSLYLMIRESYELLGLISFFTVGEDEVRAWTVKKGAAAPVAAGGIHTDLQKGFIRAEIVSYEDLTTLGSMSAARDQGKLRVEGKTYIVKDGEIMHVRFNV